MTDILPPRGRPRGDRRLLEHVAENQCGNGVVLTIQPVVLPPGSTEPPDSEQLGQSPFLGLFQTLIQNQARGDDNATIVSVSLFAENAPLLELSVPPVPPPPLAAPQRANVVARITFGVGSGTQHAFVTVKQGALATILATSLQVDGLAMMPFSILPPPQAIRLTATVDYGTRPGFEQPTFDLYRILGAGPPVEAATFAVPPFARDVTILTSSPAMLTAGAGTTVEVFQGLAPIFPALVNSLTSSLRDLPLPFTSNLVRITNGSGIAGVYYIIFRLAL